MRFYEFNDKSPAIPKLVVVEGTDALLAERTLKLLIERVVGQALADLNVDRFDASEMDTFAPIAGACAAMPFLGAARLIVVRGAHALRAPARRELAKIARDAPEGNVLAIEDLQAKGRARTEAFATVPGMLRIEVTADQKTRSRFVGEIVAGLGAEASAAALTMLSQSDADLFALRTDLEKLALLGRRIERADVERESLVDPDAKAFRVASEIIEGRTANALREAADLFEENGRGAAVPILRATADEYALVWGIARPGGDVPPRARWRERALRAAGRRLGVAGARRGFERAMRGFEFLVSGRASDGRLLVELLIAAAARDREAPASSNAGREAPG